MNSFRPRSTDHDAVARLSRALRVHPVTAQVLAARGLVDPETAKRFLQPSLADLHDPGLLRDMGPALERIAEALQAGTRIAIYGDYDVDGVCATTVLMRVLRALDGDVHAYIPHRLHDGYGLNGEALERLRAEGCGLVITVDNGTTRAVEIAAAEAQGLAVVVTDHHEPGPELPACPVVNPKRHDTTYPFAGLAGCGVAFKVALGLAEHLGRTRQESFKRLIPDLLATVAVGTVADVVPLVDENRAIVSLGLKALSRTEHPGLRALLKVSRCEGRIVRTSDVAFRLGPRINAAGRIASAQLALDLFLCDDDAERAEALAQELDQGNRHRQKIERRQAEEAFAQAESTLQHTDAPALVLSDTGWHPGVIGIVAARVTETFDKPAALITVEGESARGSARSFGNVRLHEALERCASHLETHGGHAKAAGFTLRADRIDGFRDAFYEAVVAQGKEPVGPREVDAQLPIDAISGPLALEIESLRPFGAGNDEPLFCAFGVRAAGRPRLLGPGEKHLSFYAASERTSVRAVAFNQADKEHMLDGPLDIAFVVRRRSGPEPVEIHIREMRAAAPVES